jgi:hypothetical protein
MTQTLFTRFLRTEIPTPQVSDHGVPPLSATCRVRIAVTDMNDNAPTFVRPAFTFSVAENTEADRPLGRVEATDRDSEQNGRIQYRLRSGSETFSIDQNTGRVIAPGSARFTVFLRLKNVLYTIQNIQKYLTVCATTQIYLGKY